MNEDKAILKFTGERFTPECVREMAYEHWHRYAFARQLARGKRVLDAACGEGYGTNLLADVAAEVVGVDVSDTAIAHARARYGQRENCRFEAMDCTALNFPNNHFDLVVSFETVEHVLAQEALVAGFARVLKDDGVLLISSPDKHTYSDVSGYCNEFHVRELYREEFLALLQPHFRATRLYGQKLLFQSALWALDGNSKEVEALTAAADGTALSLSLDYAPLYFVAACTKHEQALPIPQLSLFGDREESVYTHYNHEIGKNMRAGQRIAELEHELELLRARLTMSSK